MTIQIFITNKFKSFVIIYGCASLLRKAIYTYDGSIEILEQHLMPSSCSLFQRQDNAKSLAAHFTRQNLAWLICNKEFIRNKNYWRIYCNEKCDDHILLLILRHIYRKMKSWNTKSFLLCQSILSVVKTAKITINFFTK